MRIYEELFIVRPETNEEDIDAHIEQIKQLITVANGTIDKVEKWGVKTLAYRVQKRNEGYYVLIQFTSGPDVVREVERRMRVTDSVMKFITVRIDEKLKRLDKRKKLREKRAKRKPPVPVAAPGLPGSPGAAGPAPAPGAPAPGMPSIEQMMAQPPEPVQE